MTVYVALLRGVNVGGSHSLPMQGLRNLLTRVGCEDVQTYVQSGNAVFRSTQDAKTIRSDIRAAINEQFGFAPKVCLLTIEDYQSIVAANPYPEAEDTPKYLHVWFLIGAVDSPDLDTLESSKSPAERFELSDNAFYLHAPDGIGRSKLAAKVDKCLGVETTARSWRTVTKISALAESILS
jgi:uncharacterized protein (DUF1697 family)